MNLSNENSETISNLFKILELNFNFCLKDCYSPNLEENDTDDEGNKKCTGQQVELIKVIIETNGDGEIFMFYRNNEEFGGSGNSKNMKSELNQMINSFLSSKSLKNLNILSVNSNYSISYKDYYGYDGDYEILANKINENIESYSNSFKPLFSELNLSIERIELDCCGLLNIDTFSNLLNNKSIKYLYLNNCDLINIQELNNINNPYFTIKKIFE
ncbi:hypothetical protein ACTFIY_008743 [Dictyostelium cf. discoideum]